jgi:hypothetical protein
MLIEDTLEHTKKMRFGQGEDLPEPMPEMTRTIPKPADELLI